MKTRDFLGSEWEIDCMGCAISNGSMQVPGGLIQKTNYFCVHQDPLIPLPGFLVIASRSHIRSLSELQEAEYNEFSHLLRTAHAVIKKVISVEYLTVVQEESSIHFHLWFFPWTQDVIEKYEKPSLSKIRDIMTELREHPLQDGEWTELQKSIAKIKLHWQDFPR